MATAANGEREKDFLDIALVLRLSYASGRSILHGLSSAARRERCRWSFHVVNYDAAGAVAELRRVLALGADGAVAIGLYDPGIEAAFMDNPVPLVALAQEKTERLMRRRGPTAFVTSDEPAIGRIGARHLDSLGRFRSFGFVKAGRRADGFAAHFAGRQVDLRVFQPEIFGPIEPGPLGDWLEELPKPAAVMAPTDYVACMVLDAAARRRLAVPRDCAVLGVDDDELLCETSDPPLSSVFVDYGKYGEHATMALKRLLAKPNSRRFTLLVHPGRVVERQSTRPVAPATALAERAAAFIRRNAVSGISSADVSAHLGVSRSLADLRFRQVMGESMLSMILRLRLDAAAKMLKETDLGVAQVAAACGFGDADHARRLFRRRFGVSMRAWRVASTGRPARTGS